MNCRYCNESKNIYGLKNHELYCKMNPDRRSKTGENNPRFGKIGSNQHIKARDEGKTILVSNETRKKLSDSMKGRKMSDEQRIKLSCSMKKAVLNNPDSYSASNVSGRTKSIEYKGFKLKGKWELDMAKWLDANMIEWTNIIKVPFEYFWEESVHYYFPDFYLGKFNMYIEVKGYERDRDKEKWKSVENLIIIKKDEIARILNGTYQISLI